MNHSEELYQRALKVIPGGVHSPVRAFKHVKRTPLFFSHGQGPHLVDVDGKTYIDFCSSFGPHLYGHRPDFLVNALSRQILKATSFGACHEGELVLSEMILKSFPFLDKVRLVNSGTEAVMSGIRLVRGATKKNKVIKFEGCYHGHCDAMLVQSGSGVADLAEASSAGIPAGATADTVVFNFNDLDGLENYLKLHHHEVAAVLIEPMPANHGLHIPSHDHLQRVRALTQKHQVLLVFDEVISGYRVGFKGICGEYGIEPDVVCLGKIIGGGLPLAAIVGRGEVMDHFAPLGQVYQAGTLSGNPLATASGIAMIEKISTDCPYSELEKRTAYFAQELEHILKKNHPIEVRRKASIFWLEYNPQGDGFFPPEVSPEGKTFYQDFFHKLTDKGIYFAPSPFEVGFISMAHTEAVLEEALGRIRACMS